ncbi:MAG: dTMP kinase [Treponema sp.]|nr:dTMP kinase [Treponema sp.]
METMEILRNFAVFEGGDGSGTSTQIAFLERRFAGNGPQSPVFYPTFEPTGGPAGRLIRSALKREISLLPATLARLFAADRNEHVYSADGIAEHCRRGELVVSDRYTLSSLVYQGIECGDSLPRALNSSFPVPELLIFFDIDPETAAKRLQNRPSLEIYEYLEFQYKVREKYRSLADECQKSGVRVETIDAAKPPEEVAEDVWSALRKMPIFEAESGEQASLL